MIFREIKCKNYHVLYIEYSVDSEIREISIFVLKFNTLGLIFLDNLSFFVAIFWTNKLFTHFMYLKDNRETRRYQHRIFES